MVSYHVGQQVVCTNKDNWDLELILKGSDHKFIFPKYGQILTIRRITKSILPGHKANAFFTFVEIVNPKVRYNDVGFHEPAFGAHHFKPIKETPSMRQIRDILDNPCAIRFNEEVEQYQFRMLVKHTHEVTIPKGKELG